jgi:dTMP kinase
MTRQTYGKKIPGLDLRTLKGRLVVIEGADGAGRSTQIALLRELLEREGFPVTHVGLKRSKLVSDELTEAMGTTMLCARTLLLLYATDFVDQLEQAVIPSLRAGFVVISDRYIYPHGKGYRARCGGGVDQGAV